MYAYLVPPQKGMSPTTYQHVLISIQHAPHRAASSVKGHIHQEKPETHNTIPTGQDSPLSGEHCLSGVAMGVWGKLLGLCNLPLTK